MITFEKDPVEDLDYGFDLTKWLTGGEIVTALLVTADPIGLITLHDQVFTNTQVATWISGGAIGDRVRIDYRATTNSTPPRVFKRSHNIFVKRR